MSASNLWRGKTLISGNSAKYSEWQEDRNLWARSFDQPLIAVFNQQPAFGKRKLRDDVGSDAAESIVSRDRLPFINESAELQPKSLSVLL
jgi:hypothetical protein